jgi:Fe-S oxidoreductase
MEFALFACCTTELDPRNQKDGLATCALLSKAGLPYGYLGERGTCCGDMAYTAGATGLFDRLQASNLKTFGQLGRGTLLVTSPHCLQSFRNRYPAVLGLSSMHVVEVLERAVNEGRLKPGPMESKVTYHDPCYLGRYNQIYDAPRNVLKAIPGIELVEMRHHREKSMCCGGGGGGVWMERPKGERLGDVRVLEAVETGADTVVTACPFCVQMLEASVLGLNLEDKLKVKTVSEILWSTVDQGGKS